MNPDEPLPTGHEPPAANPPGADAAARRERYQGSFEFAADAQFVTDGSGVILEANDAAAVLVGYRKEFLPGKPLALLATERLRTPFYECLTRLGQGSLAEAFEARFTRSGGESRDTQVMARPGAPGTILWLVRDVTAWRRNEVARVELQLRLGASQEDERRRLSRDLHDTVGQTLTAVTLSLHAVRATGPLPEAALARLDQVQKLADELGRQLHDVAVRLRPTALDDLGLEAAARQLVEDWARRTGVATEFQVNLPAGQRLPPEIETVLYRVLQEALTNTTKYAQAKSVAVVLGRSDGNAVLVVEDDGIGFILEDVCRTPVTGDRYPLGLLGLRERVALVGGSLEVESAPGAGTAILARVPLPANRGEPGAPR